jgi:hypothetical protein
MRGMGLTCGLVAVMAAGCVSYRPVRASSLAMVPREQATARLALAPQDAVSALTDLMGQRGFPLVNKIDAAGGARYYLFKGRRRSVTSVRGSDTIIVAQTLDVGSWFAARVRPTPTGSEVFLVGKPTFNGLEACSDADVELKDGQYWCQDTKVREDWPGWGLVTGQEEADVVRGVLLTLAQRTAAP